jgi:hypothetical protein
MGIRETAKTPRWVQTFEEICAREFGVDAVQVVQALLLSPNARGYVLGSLTEILLKAHLEARGYKALRIKEKWAGTKLHHGDLYVTKNESDWYVLESKGLKSNSERWLRISDIDPSPEGLRAWFARKRDQEFKPWWDGLTAERQNAIADSGRFAEAKVLYTHFVSGRGGNTRRVIATPRKDEFHAVAIDLFLRTDRHEFAFAAPSQLASARRHSDHLKQNYLIDIVVPNVDVGPTLRAPWTWDFDELFSRFTNPVAREDMQVDERQPGAREADVSEVLYALEALIEEDEDQATLED